MIDADALADWVYRELEEDAALPLGPAWLLKRMVGRDHVHFDENAHQVFVRFVDGETWVTLPQGLAPEYRQIAFATAVAKIAARRTGQTADDRSNVLDVAAAIVMPREALALYVGRQGYSAEELAATFHVPLAFAERRMRLSGWLERSGAFSERSYRNVI